MADTTDAAVTRAIERLQAALDDLKALQGRDSDPEPKTLREAGRETRQRFAQARDSANQQ